MITFAESSDFLESATSKLEYTFQCAYEVAKDMESLDECSIAAKKILSYNPSNCYVKESFPEYSKVTEFIIERVNQITQKFQIDGLNFRDLSALGYCYLAMGDFPNAYSVLMKAKKQKNSENDSFFLYSLGIVYSHFKYYLQGIKYFQALIDLTEKNAVKMPSEMIIDAHFKLAIVLRFNKKFDESIAHFNIVADSPPNNICYDDVRMQIAFTYQLAGDFDMACLIYKEILERHPHNLKIIEQYCWFCFINLYQPDETLSILQNALDDYSYEPTIMFLLARFMLKNNNTKIAYTYYRNCINYWRDTPAFWCSFGVLYMINEQYQDAVVAFQRALYLSSEMIEAWLNLGLIFERQNQENDARRIYTSGKQSCKDNKKLDDRLKNLDTPIDKRKTYELIDVPDDQYFVQIPHEFAVQYLSATPCLPKSCFQIENNQESNIFDKIDKLATYPKSLFSP